LLGWIVPDEKKRKPAQAKRKPPLRACGARHWPKVCPQCLGNDPPAALRNSAQLSELPGVTWEDAFGGAA
jgi:hypothetical protein